MPVSTSAYVNDHSVSNFLSSVSVPPATLTLLRFTFLAKVESINTITMSVVDQSLYVYPFSDDEQRDFYDQVGHLIDFCREQKR